MTRFEARPRGPRSAVRRLSVLPVLLALSAHGAGLLAQPAASLQSVLPGDEVNGSYPGFWSWPDIVEQVESYERRYPELVRVEPIGTTYEGRAILAVKVAAAVHVDDPHRPEVLFMAGIHPREQPPQVALMQFMDELVTGYGTDERITRLLDTRQVWFIPILNVDGKVYDFANGDGESMGANWRVSRRPFENGRQGVDLNRNGLVGWGSASDTPGSGTYHGPGPLSEPETRALFDFIATRRFRIFLDVHSALEAFLVPPHLIAPEKERYARLVDGMRLRQREPYGGGPGGRESESRPDAGTGAGQTHVTGFYLQGAYSFVFEVGPPGSPARFYPSPGDILEHYERNVRESWYFLLEEAGALPPWGEGELSLGRLRMSGPVTPGATVELRPRIKGGEPAYGVLVSRDPAIRVTGEYRLYPMNGSAHVLSVSDAAEPGTRVPLELYLWDRDRRRSVVELILVIEEGG